MAYQHPVRGNYRPPRQRRHASLSPSRHRSPREWSSLTSLPPDALDSTPGPSRRHKKHHYQSSDEYQSPKYSSRFSPRRSAGDIHSSRPMAPVAPAAPTPPQILSPDRSLARLGPQKAVDYSDEDDDEPRRSRARSRARSVRPKVRLRPGNASSDDELSVELNTPTKTPLRTPATSRYRSEFPAASRAASKFRSEGVTASRNTSQFRSTPNSRQPSPQSSSDDSDADTESTADSLEDERTRRSPRSTVKNRRGTVAVPPPPATRRGVSRGRPRVPDPYDDDSGLDEDEDDEASEDSEDEMDSDDEDGRPAYPRSIRHKSTAEPVPRRLRRRRHHSEPRSSSRRDIRRRDSHDETRPSWSKRTLPKKYQASDTFSHYERPDFSRMGGTARTHVPTARSVGGGGSTRRSAAFRFFHPATLQHRHSAPVNRTAQCHECNAEWPTSKMTKLRCGHQICNGDLKQKFDDCLNETTPMPPECCRMPIRVKKVQHLFNIDYKKLWNERLAESSTPHRIYCPTPSCRQWVFPSRIRQHPTNGLALAKCAHCSTKICCSCGTKWHPRTQCMPVSGETKKNLNGAIRDGWRPCENCHQLVEVKEGCDHMSCRCGYEFCMSCTSPWKNCECPWFSMDPKDLVDQMHPEVPMTGYYSGAPSPPRDPRGVASFAPRKHRRRRSTYEEKSGLARHTPYALDEYAEDEDYVGPLGDMVGIMSDEYMPRGYAVVPPGVPSPGPAVAPFERSKLGGGYVAGANKSRGPRGSSMERRLADRFTGGRHGPDPAMRFGNHISAPPAVPMAPPAAPQPPPAATPGLRRHHTVNEETFGMGSPRGAARAEVLVPRRATHNYVNERSVHAPWGSGMPPAEAVAKPLASEEAGLTHGGGGMDRVTEWRSFVAPGMRPPSPSEASMA